MKRQRKKYDRPLKPYDKQRIEEERNLSQTYGLRRKKEIWRAESILRNFRRQARMLEARKDKEKETILLSKLNKMALVDKNATLDDVLALTLEKLLERRLQTIVFKRGLANTPKQARQYIVHGHIAVDGSKVKWPSYLVNVDEEDKIKFYPKSKVKETKLKKVTESGKGKAKGEAPKPEGSPKETGKEGKSEGKEASAKPAEGATAEKGPEVPKKA